MFQLRKAKLMLPCIRVFGFFIDSLMSYQFCLIFIREADRAICILHVLIIEDPWSYMIKSPIIMMTVCWIW